MTQTALTRLPMRCSQATRLFEEIAQSVNLNAIRKGGGLHVPFGQSMITLAPESGETAISLHADSPAALQVLRDFVAEQAEQRDLTLSWERAKAGQRPANFELATLSNICRLSPSYRRLTMEGPDLARFETGGHHLRLLFGPEGEDWPVLDAQGVTQWPGGMTAWHRPVYTIRRITRGAGQAARLDLDVFLHDGGRTTDWTGRARPGMEIGLSGPGGGRGVQGDWLGLVGDETAVPVIARILAEAPRGTRGRAVLFVPDQDDIQRLDKPTGVSVRWIIRGAAEGPLDALRALNPPSEKRFVFFAGERSDAVKARSWLAAQGFAKAEFTAAAYWTKADAGAEATE